jgi:hypothetical protein
MPYGNGQGKAPLAGEVRGEPFQERDGLRGLAPIVQGLGARPSLLVVAAGPLPRLVRSDRIRREGMELLLQEFEDHVSRVTRRSVRVKALPRSVSPEGDSRTGTRVASPGTGG